MVALLFKLVAVLLCASPLLFASSLPIGEGERVLHSRTYPAECRLELRESEILYAVFFCKVKNTWVGTPAPLIPFGKGEVLQLSVFLNFIAYVEELDDGNLYARKGVKAKGAVPFEMKGDVCVAENGKQVPCGIKGRTGEACEVQLVYKGFAGCVPYVEAYRFLEELGWLERLK